MTVERRAEIKRLLRKPNGNALLESREHAPGSIAFYPTGERAWSEEQEAIRELLAENDEQRREIDRLRVARDAFLDAAIRSQAA